MIVDRGGRGRNEGKYFFFLFVILLSGLGIGFMEWEDICELELCKKGYFNMGMFLIDGLNVFRFMFGLLFWCV